MQEEEVLFLGIDAGGTSTRCLIANRFGKVLTNGVSGPGNAYFVTAASARSSLKKALRHALQGINTKPAVAVIAGPHLPQDLPEFVIREAKAEKLIVSNEFESGLAAGLGKASGYGILLMAGTGSFCKGRNQFGQEKYSGGWGPLIGDEGSGYDIGREALIAAAQASDGRAQPNNIAEILCSELKIKGLRELRPLLYHPPMRRSRIAGLARAVSKAAEYGDSTAKKILENAGRKLAVLSAPVIRGLFPHDTHFPVILSGGILRGEPLVAATAIAEISKIHAGARISVSELAPSAGTIIIGMEAAGMDVRPEIIANLRKAEGDRITRRAR